MKKILFSILLIAMTGSTAIAQKGHLIIVGGHGSTDKIREHLVQYTGGAANSRMLIVPYADLKDTKSLDASVQTYKKLGLSVDWVDCPPEQLDQLENLAKLYEANIIYFTGGSQRALVKALDGTRFLKIIHERHENGATIAGTSAGAAIMSKVMQAGGVSNIPKGKDADNYGMIAEGYTNLEEGFGFMPEAIVDQHFIVRKRLNRLFAALLDRPDMLGIGIDETTAIDVAPDDGTFEVVGKSQVMIIEPKFQRGEIPNFNVLLLKEGDTYKYK